MRAIIVFATIFLTVHAAIFSEEWANFKVAHEKTYSTLAEEHIRFLNFQNNLKIIAEHNALYDQGLVSYKMGVNQFSDWTHEEFLNYLMASGPPPKIPHENTVVIKADPSQVQGVDIDWRTSNVVTGVKDQGQCGSCWSFSTTGSLEAAYALKGNPLVSFSEQALIDCNTDNSGCNGGWMQTAFNYIYNYGIPTEDSYPYRADEGSCQGYECVTYISQLGVVAENDEGSLEYALKTYGPVSVAIDASHLQSYAEGIFDDSDCSTTALNHAVLVVGCGNENGQDYWIVKNSWSDSWGEQGYLKMSRNKNNQCGIAAAACLPFL